MNSPSEIESISGGVCAAKGFRSSGIVCGIKNPNDKSKKDLALIYSKHPAVAAGVFTQNRVKAAPVHVSQAYLRADDPRAIIVNSGNANACTGPEGIRDARRMAELTSRALDIRRRQVLVCSTGIIGQPMPMDRIEPRVLELVEVLAAKDSKDAAEAIMTSDTVSKSAAVRVKIGGRKVRIGAIAKGAGMINPHMATMLCFVTTDANIEKAELERATREAVELSFNRITIDGDMSTNDTVLVMANGRAKNPQITAGGPGCRQFREALTYLMLKMAKKIVSDGERVTKMVEVCVHSAKSQSDAEKVARAVANSFLVKASWNGNDPNWGRVMHAVGYSGARVQEELIDIYFEGLCAVKGGLGNGTPLRQLQQVAAKKRFTLRIDLNQGNASYYVFASDISPDYIDFNRKEYAAPK